MKYDDEYTERRWELFQSMIADELLARKLVAYREEAKHFAGDLETSFEEDYNPVGLQYWPDLIKRDADEYEKDQNRGS